jgi:parvulin-like peptidyl-prolyl isomerase
MLKLFFLLALVLGAGLGARAETVAGNTNAALRALADDTVVARGKGLEIRWRAMHQVLATAQLNDPSHALPPEAEVQVLNQLIEIELVMQHATAEEKAAGQKAAAERMTGILKMLSQGEFERRLKATDMTADDLRNMIFQEQTAQASLGRQLGIKVTEADARKWFADHPGAYDQPAKAHVRELLLLTTSDFTTSAAPPLPEATLKAKRALIADLDKRIRAGEDFAVLARQYDEDPISKNNGGELTFSRDQMDYGDLAFSMKPNQISGVVTNEAGLVIFQLLEIIPPHKAEFGELAEQLKQMLVGRDKRLLAPDYIRQLRKAAGVEVVEPRLKALVAENEAAGAAQAKAQAEFAAKEAARATNAPTAKP